MIVECVPILGVQFPPVGIMTPRQITLGETSVSERNAVETGTATQSITLEDSVQISDDAVFRELDGEAVILNLDTGIYFGLNTTGTRIWNLIAQHGSLQKVFETMAEEYDVPPESLENDILLLVGQLAEKKLVSVSPLPG